MSDQQRTLDYQPALDGVRAVAVTLVVVLVLVAVILALETDEILVMVTPAVIQGVFIKAAK